MEHLRRLDNFVILEELFHSRGGAVYKARNKIDHKVYVIKERHCAELGCKRDIMNEANLLSSLSHETVIKLYTSFWDANTGHLYMILEYAGGGDLSQVLQQRRRRKQPFSSSQLWSILTQLSKGLHHMHKQGIIHRDIKPMNVLLTEQGRLKIADLGVSRLVGEDTLMLRTYYGTPLYTSPELCEGRDYCEKADIWSLGVLLYEVALMDHPFKAPSLVALAQVIKEGKYKPLPERCSSRYCKVVESMLQVDPAKRPSIGQVLRWVKDHETRKTEVKGEKKRGVKPQSAHSCALLSRESKADRAGRSKVEVQGLGDAAALARRPRLKLEAYLRRCKVQVALLVKERDLRDSSAPRRGKKQEEERELNEKIMQLEQILDVGVKPPEAWPMPGHSVARPQTSHPLVKPSHPLVKPSHPLVKPSKQSKQILQPGRDREHERERQGGALPNNVPNEQRDRRWVEAKERRAATGPKTSAGVGGKGLSGFKSNQICSILCMRAAHTYQPLPLG
ncbi:unnamed protein product [Chrysoparadoxa australica]